MAEVKNFLYCERVGFNIINDKPESTLTNPFMVLSPKFIPGTISFSMFIAISEDDRENSHNFRIIFKKVGEEENLIDTQNQSLPQLPNEGLPEESSGYMLNMDFRDVVIRNQGKYESQVYFDGKLIGTYPIYAKAVENNG